MEIRRLGIRSVERKEGMSCSGRSMVWELGRKVAARRGFGASEIWEDGEKRGWRVGVIILGSDKVTLTSPFGEEDAMATEGGALINWGFKYQARP
jgi:hypothetical protein